MQLGQRNETSHHICQLKSQITTTTVRGRTKLASFLLCTQASLILDSSRLGSYPVWEVGDITALLAALSKESSRRGDLPLIGLRPSLAFPRDPVMREL